MPPLKARASSKSQLVECIADFLVGLALVPKFPRFGQHFFVNMPQLLWYSVLWSSKAWLWGQRRLM